MKKIIIFAVISLFFLSCKNSKNQNSDDLTKTNSKTNEKAEKTLTPNPSPLLGEGSLDFSKKINLDEKKSENKIKNKIDQDSILDLMNSSKTGDLYKVDKYIKTSKMSVNSKDIRDRTPLMSAAFGNKVEVIKYLLKNGADITMRDIHGGTALMWAVNGNAPDAISTLLDNGASPDELLNGKQSVLMLSARVGDEKIFNLLLTKEVKTINHKDSEGKNLLHWAILGKNETIIKKVLELKVSKTDKDINNKTPFDYAKELKLTNIEKLLEK